jgi:hypothetical protein
LNYVGIYGDPDTGFRSKISAVISYYIVLFPAIDGLAIYPLMSVCLGDILMGAFYGNRVHDVEKNWKIRILFRLLASIPQAVLAIFVRDLGVVAIYAGICTLLAYTVCPTVLYLASKRYMDRHNLPIHTMYYSRLFSLNAVAYALLLGVALVICGVIIESIFVATK